MKKILLATTILGLSAGYAAADITWAGTATAGIARQGGTEATAKVAALKGKELKAAQDAAAAEVKAARERLKAAKKAAKDDANADNLAAVAAAALNLASIQAWAATVGVAVPAVDATGPGDFHTYSSFNLAATASGTSDSGLTFGATFDVTFGTSYALGDDDGFTAEAGTLGMPTIFVEGSFGKLAISDDNFDLYDDAHGGGDIQYSGTFGAVTVGLTADVDNNVASAKVGYTAGALSISADMDNAVNTDSLDNINDGTDEAQWNVSATYTMGTIAVTAATNQAEESSLKVAYTGANGISGSAQFNSSDNSVDIAAGYAANGLTVNADTNSETNHWTVTASYDLGGGLSVRAGTNYTQDMMVGASMSF